MESPFHTTGGGLGEIDGRETQASRTSMTTKKSRTASVLTKNALRAVPLSGRNMGTQGNAKTRSQRQGEKERQQGEPRGTKHASLD